LAEDREVTEADAWPTELRLLPGGKGLRVSFDDGAAFELSAEYLRVESPSAEVRGHAPHERKVVSGAKDVRITDVVPTGNYAVRLVFDDGHSTGIYSWPYLYELGRDHEARWRGHLNELASKGLAR
jgi:DUF971 family protein